MACQWLEESSLEPHSALRPGMHSTPTRHCLSAPRQIQQHQHNSSSPYLLLGHTQAQDTAARQSSRRGAVCVSHSSHSPREAPCLLLLPLLPPTATQTSSSSVNHSLHAQAPRCTGAHTQAAHSIHTQDGPDSPKPPNPAVALLHSQLWHQTCTQARTQLLLRRFDSNPLNSVCRG